MDESFILSQFDAYVKSGLVLYDDKQKVIEHVDGKLRVSVAQIHNFEQWHNLVSDQFLF